MASAVDMRDLARLALAETIDAMEVLSAGALAKEIEPSILSSRAMLLAARLTLESAQDAPNPTAIGKVLAAAVRHLRAARSSLADPATLPRSFRN